MKDDLFVYSDRELEQAGEIPFSSTLYVTQEADRFILDIVEDVWEYRIGNAAAVVMDVPSVKRLIQVLQDHVSG